MRLLTAYALLTFVIFSSLFLTPYVAMAGFDASLSYSASAFICHQYPSRSFAAYPSGIRDCISDGSIVLTVFEQPLAEPYNGTFYYSRSDIGFLRPQVCVTSGEVGFKFPVCARDMGFYFGLFAGALLYLRSRRSLNGKTFLLMVLPFAVDGLGQFLGFWESTNIIRAATGLLAGVAVSLALGGVWDD